MSRPSTHDAIIIGAGVIGVSLALELESRGLKTLLIERGEPGREASWAAAGMLTLPDWKCGETFRTLANASLSLYPAFVEELERESGEQVDYRTQGALLLLPEGELGFAAAHFNVPSLSAQELTKLEPSVAAAPAVRINEASLDPRAMLRALLSATKKRGISVAYGSPVTELITSGSAVVGARTRRAEYHAKATVNCAGAWAEGISPVPIATPPCKGHMLALIPPPQCRIEHVIRSGHFYLVPRSDGRILAGSTVEDAGFDKNIDPSIIQGLHQAAAALAPQLGEARTHEVWTGLRPGSPDGLPTLGPTGVTGYYLATGHFRDGILLAPVTARLLAQSICGERTDVSLLPFSATRFSLTQPLD